MEKLHLINAETLYYTPLDHPRILIDGILSNGLAILSGDSKIGKSWMVLWFCLKISRGEPVWGLPTSKTDVIYLALEDNPATGLLFIDTLQMVRDNVSSRVNAYAQDYKDLSALKKIADDHKMCIF